MTAATSRLRRRGIGAGVAALVGLSGLGLAAAIPAQAVASFDLTRPADTSDRFATAASVATSAFTTSTNVIIANGDNAVDALSASYLAGTTTPILYVTSTSVPAATAAAITKLGATNAWVVGGTTAIPASVFNAISTTTKTRIAGDDRYKTAVAVGNAKAAQGTKPTTAFIARGDQFADALAIAPVAAKSGIPILLTEPGSLNADTLAALKAWGITSVTIIGGPSAVSENVATSLTAQGVTSTRIAGSTRSGTAAAVANTASFGFAKTSVYIVNGFRPVDALPAAVAAAKANAPVLLTEDGVLGADTQKYLSDNAATLTSGVAVGGTTVLPASVETAAETAGGAVASNATIAVAPADATSLTIASDTGSNVTSDDRTYTVTGLNSALDYRITLVNGTSIQRAANGSVSFLTSTAQDTAGRNLVDPGVDIADLVSVNNAGPVFTTAENTDKRTLSVRPVNGSITFTVDGTAPGTVVPVVYVNGAAGGTSTTGGINPRLETTATTAGVFAPASESFGLGGSVLYTATRASNGTFVGSQDTVTPAPSTPAVISVVDKTANTFTATIDTDNTSANSATVRSFAFDANDTYSVGGVSVGFDTFKAALSVGDGITGTYTTDAGGVSSFSLTDSNPVLSGASATAGAGASVNDITLAATFVADSLDSVTIERAPGTGGSVGTYVPVTTVTPTTVATSLSFVDNDVAAGDYTYRFTPINDGDPGVPVLVTRTVTSPAAVDSTAPTLIDTRLSTSGGLGGTLDTGDIVTLVFSEDVVAPPAGTLRVRDADGTIANITGGVNAVIAQAGAAQTVGGVSVPATRIVTVTINGAITTSAAGTTPDVQIPATIIDQAGFADGSSNALNLPGSADVVIDVES